MSDWTIADLCQAITIYAPDYADMSPDEAIDICLKRGDIPGAVRLA